MRLRYTVLAGSLASSLAGLVMVAPAADAAPVIKFGVIQYNSPGTDKGSNKSLNAEYVVIKNVGRNAKKLTGWRLRDRAGHVYKFGTFTLRAGRSVTVHTGKGKNTAAHRYWGREWYVWNNTGDRAALRNASRQIVDICSWRGGGTRKHCR